METAAQPSSGVAAAPKEAPYPSAFYSWYCVILLLCIYLNSFLDRQMLALIVGPIKKTMALSDTQVGFLMGPAFAIFYTVAGLPLGWLADRMSRRLLIGIGQVCWSMASASFGLGRTYPQLISARIGVGMGEASLSPSAYSLIADLFPPHKLARALSVYGMGIYVGGGLANLVGGLVTKLFGVDTVHHLPIVGDRLGWQMIFFVTALPVLPLTLLLPTLKEPARRGLRRARDARGELQVENVPMSMFLRYAWQNRRTVICHGLGFACLSFSGYGAAAWTPEFFIRLHGWSREQVGVYLGLTGMIAGPLGLLFGGWLGDRLNAMGYRDSKMRVGIIAAVIWFPFGIASPLMPSGELAFWLAVPATLFAAMPWGIAPAAIQEIMPNQMRGQASAIYLFIISLIGLGLGPQALALVTDHVFKDEHQIHLSLLWTTTAAHTAAAALLFFGLKAFRASRDGRDKWVAEHAGG